MADPTKRTPQPQPTREVKLAEALRANLRRRKASDRAMRPKDVDPEPQEG